jgi:hypothetical protein
VARVRAGDPTPNDAPIPTFHEPAQEPDPMKMSEAFPSNYLKADVDVPDLEDGGIVLTISSVEMKAMKGDDGNEQKVIVEFEEVDKGLVCNKTNATTIAGLYGDDTDDWIGQKVQLYAKDVEFQGKMTRGIRVSTRAPRAKKAAEKTAPAKAAPVSGPTGSANDPDDGDDIPF